MPAYTRGEKGRFTGSTTGATPPTVPSLPTNRLATPPTLPEGTQAVISLSPHVSLPGETLAILQPIAQRFHENGYPLYLVGGSVRDAALGEESKDLDLTTSAHPTVIQNLVASHSSAVWDVGAEYGTIAFLDKTSGSQIEITTFRADVYHSGSRKPEVSFGDTLEGDLTRRDFTINAIAIDLTTGRTLDPHHGLEDLHNRILRTPGDPTQSFTDDPLRIMRAVRFVGQHGLTLDPIAREAMTAVAPQLEMISRERIHQELWRTLGHPTGAPESVRILHETGVMRQVLPEVAGSESVTVSNLWQVPVDSAMDIQGFTVDDRAVTALASLFHDAHVPPRLARDRVSNLRGTRAQAQQVEQILASTRGFASLRNLPVDQRVRTFAYRAGPNLPHAAAILQVHPLTREAWREHSQAHSALAEREDLADFRVPLTGEDILGAIGGKPGPRVGAAQRFLQERRLSHGPETPERLLQLLEQWSLGTFPH